MGLFSASKRPSIDPLVLLTSLSVRLSWLYSQMPYEAISEEQYKHQTSKLRKLEFTRDGQPPRGVVRVEEVPDKFCETDACVTTVSVDAIKLDRWGAVPATFYSRAWFKIPRLQFFGDDRATYRMYTPHTSYENASVPNT